MRIQDQCLVTLLEMYAFLYMHGLNFGFFFPFKKLIIH